MIIDKINLNHLRIFECVFRTGSMTAAAQELHLTQSGVSQHIRSLEDVLEIKLFDRFKRRVIPTDLAGTLYRKCADSFGEIEQTLATLKGVEVQLKGVVNIGVPMEFGNNIILPRLSVFCKMHPGIRFTFHYGLAAQLSEELLRGELDFAFVDGFGVDRRITVQPVYDEVLSLCVNGQLLDGDCKMEETRQVFESMDYVDYQVGEPVLKLWFDHHLGHCKLNLNVRATVMNAQGVAHVIKCGLAAGILPGHLVSKLEKEGWCFYQFKGCGKPLKNKISLAHLQDRSQSPASLEMMRWLVNQT